MVGNHLPQSLHRSKPRLQPTKHPQKSHHGHCKVICPHIHWLGKTPKISDSNGTSCPDSGLSKRRPSSQVLVVVPVKSSPKRPRTYRCDVSGSEGLVKDTCRPCLVINVENNAMTMWNASDRLFPTYRSTVVYPPAFWDSDPTPPQVSNLQENSSQSVR